MRIAILATILVALSVFGCGSRTESLTDTVPIDTSEVALTAQPGAIGAVSVGGSRTFVTRNNTVEDNKGHFQTTSKIYASGIRNFGVLGDGCTGTCGSAPTPEVIFTEVCPQKNPCVVDIESGSAHTLILDYLGNVYHVGGSFNGEACKIDVRPNVSDVTPTLIGSGTDRIAAGGYNSWFHSVSGGWFFCGYNSLGESGIEGNTTSPLIAAEVDPAPSGGDWTKIAGGSNHTLFLDGESVYAMGDNGSCESGTGNPARLSGILCGFDAETPVTISAGAATSMCAGTASGQQSVWTWGDNSNGELGDGSSGPNRCAPGKAYVVPTLDSASESAYGHTAIISYHTTGGATHFACAGDNHQGQCAVSPVSLPNVTNFVLGDTILTDGLALVQRSWADSGGDSVRVDASHLRDIGNNAAGQLGIGTLVSPQLSWQSTTGF